MRAFIALCHFRGIHLHTAKSLGSKENKIKAISRYSFLPKIIRLSISIMLHDSPERRWAAFPGRG